MKIAKIILKAFALFMLFGLCTGGIGVFVEGMYIGGSIMFFIGIIPAILIIRSLKDKTPDQIKKMEDKNIKRNEKRIIHELSLYGGFDKNSFIGSLKYKCGHPAIDQSKVVNLGLKDKNIYFMNFKKIRIAEIKGELIKNVLVEDDTTFEKRVSLAGLFLVGIFAFGMKKKQKNELAYITIEWNDGRFDHSTIFEYDGPGSLIRANKDRNKIISQI